jgi:exodeoxyribonuclease VII small subunit
MSDKAVKEMSFEDAMKELETVVARLESGDVPLEESIRLYERGAVLKEHCQKKLAEAEEKVAQITLDENGQPKGTTPVDVS